MSAEEELETKAMAHFYLLMWEAGMLTDPEVKQKALECWRKALRLEWQSPVNSP